MRHEDRVRALVLVPKQRDPHRKFRDLRLVVVDEFLSPFLVQAREHHHNLLEFDKGPILDVFDLKSHWIPWIRLGQFESHLMIFFSFDGFAYQLSAVFIVNFF